MIMRDPASEPTSTEVTVLTIRCKPAGHLVGRVFRDKAATGAVEESKWHELSIYIPRLAGPGRKGRAVLRGRCMDNPLPLAVCQCSEQHPFPIGSEEIMGALQHGDSTLLM